MPWHGPWWTTRKIHILPSLCPPLPVLGSSSLCGMTTELMLLASLAMFCAALGQSQNVVEASAASSQQLMLGPIGPNPLLAVIQADPNFLRFGRSSPAVDEQEFGQMEEEKRAPVHSQSANFLRFGKSPHSEPNFLRFGRRVQEAEEQGMAAKRLSLLKSSQPKGLRAVSAGVEPSLLRFGRAGATKTNNFLRFGRRAPGAGELMAIEDAEEPFERDYRQPNPNFLRFG